MKLSSRIRKKMVQAIADYQMLEEGDHVLVGVSGGVDSTIMLLMLKEVQKKAPYAFKITPVFLQQNFPDFNPAPFLNWIRDKGFDPTILDFDTFSVVEAKTKPGKSICRICSRLRRGILYTYATDNNYSKIALGHQLDDYNEILLLNLLFSGKMKSMAPNWKSLDGRNTIIRPLSYLPKSSILELHKELKFPVLSCEFCEGRLKDSGREKLRQVMRGFEQLNPDYQLNMFAAQKNIALNQLPISNPGTGPSEASEE
jgi:tRNA 2-thiocytidine biosynthesis protein TtcA